MNRTMRKRPARTSPSASLGGLHICLPEPEAFDGTGGERSVGWSVIGRGSGLLLSLEVDLGRDLRDAVGEDDDEVVAPCNREGPAHGFGLVLRLLDRAGVQAVPDQSRAQVPDDFSRLPSAEVLVVTQDDAVEPRRGLL